MRRRGAVVGAWLLLAGANHAHATTKICIPHRVSVPENPRLIVKRDNLGVVPKGAVVETISDDYASVTLPAKAGEIVGSIHGLHAKCGVSYQVVADWKTSLADPRVVRAEARPWEGLPTSGLQLQWRQRRWGSSDENAWTRVDWAYSAKALEQGLYGTEMSGRGSTWLAVVADFEVVHVRLTQYRSDGSERSWRGWVHQDANGDVHVGEGDAPVQLRESRPSKLGICSTETRPRPVPVNPEFEFSDHQRPRFVATTLDGRQLPTTVAAGDYRSRGARVQAPAGTVFRVHRLPLVPGCEKSRPLMATSDRSRDVPPTVVAVRARHFDFRERSEQGQVYDDLFISVADSASWGQLEVEWAASRDELGQGEHVGSRDPQNVRLSAAARRTSDPDDVPVDFVLIFVRVTPVWSGGSRGAPWEGWIHRDPATRRITFGSLVGEALDSPAATAAKEPPLMRAAARESCGLGQLVLVPVFGLLIFAVALRRRSPSARTPTL